MRPTEKVPSIVAVPKQKERLREFLFIGKFFSLRDLSACQQKAGSGFESTNCISVSKP